MITIFKILTWTAGITVGVYLALLIYLFFNQKSMVYFPQWNFITTPEQQGMKYEDVILPISEEELVHGWFFESENNPDTTNKRVVLFCHGNAGNISHRISTAQSLLEMGADVFMFDYRGYGHSLGEPSEENTYKDALICFDWLSSHC